MRSVKIAVGALVILLSASCGGGGSTFPTEKEIVNSLEETLRSIAGDWTGLASGPNGIRFEFRLQEGSNGQVTGSGTMKEDNAAATVPITVTGTFQRPTLALTFNGMVYEGRQVSGVAQGSYTTVGGIATTLMLTAPGYSKNLTILLQEK